MSTSLAQLNELAQARLPPVRNLEFTFTQRPTTTSIPAWVGTLNSILIPDSGLEQPISFTSHGQSKKLVKQQLADLCLNLITKKLARPEHYIPAFRGNTELAVKLPKCEKKRENTRLMEDYLRLENDPTAELYEVMMAENALKEGFCA